MVTSGTAVIQQANDSFREATRLPSLRAAADTAPVGSAVAEHPDKARYARLAGNQQGTTFVLYASGQRPDLFTQRGTPAGCY